MIGTAIRKARQFAGDEVLRRWLAGRMLGRHGRGPSFSAHRPPYLGDRTLLAAETSAPPTAFAELPAASPEQSLEIDLAGTSITVDPGPAGSPFDRQFADRETELALHRFAWLPVLGDAADPAWVQALWTAWRQRHGDPGDGWAWHPYTAAERAANIVAFAHRHGLPGPIGDTLAVLAAHGPAIAARLEYFGDHYTSNHLANNGRGLFLLGLALGLPACTDLGGRILCHEAARLFGTSGMLREASSHYHVLLAKQYVECWLAARLHGRAETADLGKAAARALAVIPTLVLGGGMPLIGDISPDCSPAHLGDLTTSGTWRGALDDESRQAVDDLAATAPLPDDRGFADDGWLRADIGPWSGLWHVAPGGWSPMPGHGHQDAGGFEIHHGGAPLFVDSGRGTYGDTGDAALYASARVHNGVLVDGADPYAPNRPYYDDAFRRDVGGAAPILERDGDAVHVRHYGYGRLAGVGAVDRQWRFTEDGFSIADRVEGRGRRTIRRLLHTPLPVSRDGDVVVIENGDRRVRITADGPIDLRPLTRWTAYGRGTPATAIDVAVRVTLPWSGSLAVGVA